METWIHLHHAQYDHSYVPQYGYCDLVGKTE